MSEFNETFQNWWAAYNGDVKSSFAEEDIAKAAMRFGMKIEDDAAMSMLSDKLKENDATFSDILAISALVPSLVPLVKAINTPWEERALGKMKELPVADD